MKLHQEVISEGQGPVPVVLTLDEIIKAGKVTNSYQTFVLGWLSEFFKNGLKAASLHLENPITFDSKATSVELVSALKALSPAEGVKLAQYLKDCVAAGECMLHNRQATVVDWIRFVLAKQD